jgi:hypothetical protein
MKSVAKGRRKLHSAHKISPTFLLYVEYFFHRHMYYVFGVSGALGCHDNYYNYTQQSSPTLLHSLGHG